MGGDEEATRESSLVVAAAEGEKSSADSSDDAKGGSLLGKRPGGTITMKLKAPVCYLLCIESGIWCLISNPLPSTRNT